jgi:hypothetical protein
MSWEVSSLITLQKAHDRYNTEKTKFNVEHKYNSLKNIYTKMGCLPVFEQELAKQEFKKGAFVKIARENTI